MKKLIAAAASLALLMSAVSCSSKPKADSDGSSDNNSSGSVNDPPSVTITQLKYKQTDIKFPEDNESRLGLYYYSGEVRYIYRTNDDSLKVICYDKDMNPTRTISLTEPIENISSVYADVKPDGTISLFIETAKVDVTIPDMDTRFKNADVERSIYNFSPEGELIGQITIDGLDNYIQYGFGFYNSFYAVDESYIISTVDTNIIIDSSGSISDAKECSGTSQPAFGYDSEGRLIAGCWKGYKYIEGTDFDVDENDLTEYGDYIFRTGAVFTGQGDFKAFMVMNEGIYGLTFKDEFIQIVDFTDSNISPNGIWYAAYAGEGQFVIMGDDQSSGSGMFFSLLTVRPDDYVENKDTIILGSEYDDNAKELAMLFNKKNDNYKVEVRSYHDTDNLKLDVLAGDAPDVYSFHDSTTMYRYANLGAFKDLYKEMAAHDDVKPEDIMDNVLAAYEYKDGLYALPMVFNIDAFMANRDVISRDFTHWSYEDFFSFAENLPEGMHLGSQNSYFTRREGVFDRLVNDSIGAWVDYDNYTCNFDSDEFLHLLHFCSELELNEPIEWENNVVDGNSDEYHETTLDLYRKKALLNEMCSFHYLNDFVNYPISFGLFTDSSFTFLTPPGDGHGTITTANAFNFALLNNSPNPEGGWEFFNFVMDGDTQRNYLQTSFNFGSSKKNFEEDLKALRENEFQVQIDPEQNYGDFKHTWIEDKDYKVMYISDEDYQYIYDFIMSCDRLSDHDQKLYDIVKEEYTKLAAGDCTPEECAAMIQNRASLYLSEQS